MRIQWNGVDLTPVPVILRGTLILPGIVSVTSRNIKAPARYELNRLESHYRRVQYRPPYPYDVVNMLQMILNAVVNFFKYINI